MAEPTQLSLPFSVPITVDELGDLGAAKVRAQADNPEFLGQIHLALDAYENFQALAGLKLDQATFDALNQAINNIKDNMVAELSKVGLPLNEDRVDVVEGVYAPYMAQVAFAMLAMLAGPLLEERTVTDRYAYIVELVRAWAMVGIAGTCHKAGVPVEKVQELPGMGAVLRPVPMQMILRLAKQKAEMQAEAAQRGITLEDLAREKLKGAMAEGTPDRKAVLANAAIRGDDDDQMAF